MILVQERGRCNVGTEVGGPGTVGTVNDEVRSRWRTEPAYVRHGPKPGDERRAAAAPRAAA